MKAAATEVTSGDRTDRALVARAAEGDHEAFRVLYERYAERVYRYALTLVRRRHLAEEVVQETLVAVWKSASRFEGRSKVSTWILGIARYRALDLARREARGARVPAIDLVEPDPAPTVERSVVTRAALEKLSPEHREVVFLAFYEGLSYEEIAAMSGVPEGTVKSRMYYAKQALAEALT
ncbi:MAG: sigma-70 family RNA polymerase sigma factor [Candidatus Bipolaricaulota bacterium]